MLTGPTKESQENCVDLKGVSGAGLELLINFIYSGEMEVNIDNLTEVLNAATHLQITSAVDLCSDYINAQLNFGNAEQFLEVADLYSLSKVLVFFDQMVLNDFIEFSKSSLYFSLSQEKLLKYLSSDELRILSDRLLIECVARWYQHNKSADDDFGHVLEKVRFKLLADYEIVQIQQNWVNKLPNILPLLTEALQYRREIKGRLPVSTSTVYPRATEKSLVLVHQGSSFRPFEITAYNHQTSKFYQLVSDISGSRDCRIAVLENFLYVCRVVDCGGGALMNSMVRFDPSQLELLTLQPCKWIRIDPTLVPFNKKLYILGGMSEHHVLIDSVECYDAITNQWKDIDRLPTPTHALASTVCKNNIFVSGGISAKDQHIQNQRVPSASLSMLDPDTGTWSSKPDMQFARRLHEMCTIHDKIYVVGGIGLQSYHQQSQMPMECFDTKTEQWTCLASTLAGRSVGHFLHFQEGILSVGREHQQATEDDIWLYDMESDSWKQFAKVVGLLQSLFLLNDSVF